MKKVCAQTYSSALPPPSLVEEKKIDQSLQSGRFFLIYWENTYSISLLKNHQDSFLLRCFELLPEWRGHQAH